MTLEKFLKQKYIEEQKYLWKQEIMASPGYKATMFKDQLLEARMKNFQENRYKSYSFDDEYQKMISLLNFVFPSIPKDRYTVRDYLFLTDEEMEKYNEVQELKDQEIICEINENSRKCFCLLSYLLLMKTSALGSKIRNIEEEIKNLFHSFSNNFQRYQYKTFCLDEVEDKSDAHSQRKTHDNKGELLDGLYERVFIKRSDSASDDEKAFGITPYINEKEKSMISFLLNIDPDEQKILFSAKQWIIDQLIRKDQSELDETQKAEKAYEKSNQMIYAALGEELLDEAQRLYCYYEGEKEEIQWGIKEPPPVKESAFENLNPEEVDFMNYLYQLYYSNCEKYKDTDKSEDHDVRNPKNSRRWDILKKDERETLASYIEKLCDDDRILFKYIRKKDFMVEKKSNFFCGENSEEDQIFEFPGFSDGGWRVKNISDQAKEMIYSLVASIRDDPYYHTSKRLERLCQFIKAAPGRLDLENPDIKRLYSDLEAKIKNADSIYFKLSKCLYDSAPKVWLKEDI